MSKISIIVPCFNAEKYIEKCISSIIQNTFSDFEIIIVDDGSTDNSKGKILDFLNKDFRIKYFYQTNSGVSSARNTGIEKATGDYIVFIDSDDDVSPNYLSDLFDNSNNGEYFVLGSVLEKNQSGVIKNLRNHQGTWSTSNIKELVLSGKIYGSVTSSIFKTSVLRENSIKFTTEIIYCEDLLFLFDYLNEFDGECLIIDGANYYHSLDNEDSATNNRLTLKYAEAYKLLPTLIASRVEKSFQKYVNSEYALSVYRLMNILDFKSFSRVISDIDYRKCSKWYVLPKAGFKFTVIYYLFVCKLSSMLWLFRKI